MRACVPFCVVLVSACMHVYVYVCVCAYACVYGYLCTCMRICMCAFCMGDGARSLNDAFARHVQSFRSSVSQKRIIVSIDEQEDTWAMYDYGPKSVLCPILFLAPVSGSADIFFKQLMSLGSQGIRCIAVRAPCVFKFTCKSSTQLPHRPIPCTNIATHRCTVGYRTFSLIFAAGGWWWRLTCSGSVYNIPIHLQQLFTRIPPPACPPACPPVTARLPGRVPT